MKEHFNELCNGTIAGLLAFGTLFAASLAIGYSFPVLPVLAATNTYPVVRFASKLSRLKN